MRPAFALALAMLVSQPLARAQPSEAPDVEPSEDVVDTLGHAVRDVGEAMGPDASPHPRIRWDPSWPRYRFDELVLTAGMGVVIVLAEFLPTRSDPNWSGVTLLDRAAQDALGLDSPSERHALEATSDALVTALLAWPAVDSLLYAGLGEGAWDVAWQTWLIALEAVAVNHALNITIKLLSRRERPLGVYCRARPGYDADPVCRDPPPAESFWSGHVSNAFAAAAVTCLHHDVLDLFGDEAADFATCGGALALATSTAPFRVMSDRHWVTDVLAGAIVGSLIGALLPWFLHYRGGARPPLRGTEPPPMVLLPLLDEHTIGIGSAGLW